MDMEKEKLFEQIKGGLIVSCQALETEPLYTKEGGVMPLMAKAAAMSGAVGIRANTVRDITQIKQVVDLPVIGIIKKDYPGTPMYITVTMKEVDELVACGVDILAVRGGKTYAIQCKNYAGAVDNAAVQEAYAGAEYYGCDVPAVVCPTMFTASARELAESTGVELWDGERLSHMMRVSGRRPHHDPRRDDEL